MSEEEKMFNEFQNLSIRIRSLSGIVQNEGATHSNDELIEWSNLMDRYIEDVATLHLKVVTFYGDKEVG